MDIDVIRELAAIPLASLAVFLMYKLAANHLNTLGAAVNRMAEAIDDLKDFLASERRRR